MRSWVIDDSATGKSWIQRTLAEPRLLGPTEVRIAIRAVSLNYRDLTIVRGTFGDQILPGLIPGSDGAGEVIETGSAVWRTQVGARVALTFNPDWIGGPWRATPGGLGRGGAVHGVLCEQVVVDQLETVPVPGHLSFAEAATLPCAAVTAWTALSSARPLLPGQTVLVQGSGGVAVFALQLAKLFGARVIATSSTDEKCARLLALGADAAINYRTTPEWSKPVLDLTGGEGCDLVIEIGGAESFAQSIAATRPGGRISIVGLMSGLPAPGPGLFARSVSVDSIRVGSRDDFLAMNAAIEFHRLRPVIERKFAFDDAAQALRTLAAGGHFGKLVVEVS